MNCVKGSLHSFRATNVAFPRVCGFHRAQQLHFRDRILTLPDRLRERRAERASDQRDDQEDDVDGISFHEPLRVPPSAAPPVVHDVSVWLAALTSSMSRMDAIGVSFGRGRPLAHAGPWKAVPGWVCVVVGVSLVCIL